MRVYAIGKARVNKNSCVRLTASLFSRLLFFTFCSLLLSTPFVLYALQSSGVLTGLLIARTNRFWRAETTCYTTRIPVVYLSFVAHPYNCPPKEQPLLSILQPTKTFFFSFLPHTFFQWVQTRYPPLPLDLYGTSSKRFLIRVQHCRVRPWEGCWKLETCFFSPIPHSAVFLSLVCRFACNGGLALLYFYTSFLFPFLSILHFVSFFWIHWLIQNCLTNLYWARCFSSECLCSLSSSAGTMMKICPSQYSGTKTTSSCCTSDSESHSSNRLRVPS